MQTGFLIFAVFDCLKVLRFVNYEWKGISLGVAGRYGIYLEGYTVSALVENREGMKKSGVYDEIDYLSILHSIFAKL